jgi:hypothetical protein
MAATMHAKINRRKLDKLNIIKIWLLFNTYFIFHRFSSTSNNALLFSLLNFPVFFNLLQRRNFESISSNGSQTLRDSHGSSSTLSLFFLQSLPCTHRNPLFHVILRRSCDCLRAKSKTPLRYSFKPLLNFSNHIFSIQFNF